MSPGAPEMGRSHLSLGAVTRRVNAGPRKRHKERGRPRIASAAGVAALPLPPYRSGVSGLSFFTLCFPSLFSIVDPIACVPVYLALVGSEERSEQQRTAARATLTATLVLCLFAAMGTAIFR